MVTMSDLSAEIDMASPPQSPPSAITSTVNMQEMDMEQDDDDMNVSSPPPIPQPPPPPRGAPAPPMMISRIPLNQPSLPPAIPTDKLPAPLNRQDLIIKSYNPKGKIHFYRFISDQLFIFTDKMFTINQSEQYLISPITKEKISAKSISDHTKYGERIYL